MAVKSPDRQNLNPATNPGDDEFNKIIDRNFSPEEREGLNAQADQSERTAQDLSSREDGSAIDGGSSAEDIVGQEQQGSERGGWRTNVSSASPKRDLRQTIITNLKTKKGIGLFAGGGILLAGGGIFTLILLQGSLALLSIVSNAFDKGDYRPSSTFSKRIQRVQERKMASSMTKGCTIKVKCRFKGMSKKEIDKFERRNPGTTIKTQNCKFGKCKVKSITYIGEDGKKKTVEAKDLRSAIKNSPNLRENIKRYNNPKTGPYRDVKGKIQLGIKKVYRGLAKLFNKEEDLDDPAKRKAEEKRRVKAAVSGEEFNANIGRRTIAGQNPDGTPVDTSTEEQIADEIDEDIRSNVDQAKEAESLGKSFTGKLKGGPLALFGGSVCMVRSFLSLASAAVKLKSTTTLIRYWAMFAVLGGQILQGNAQTKGATGAIAVLVGILYKKNSTGKSGPDAAMYQWAANNKKPANDKEYAKYKLGYGTSGKTSKVVNNKLSKAGCKIINAPSAAIGWVIAKTPGVSSAAAWLGGQAGKVLAPILGAAMGGLVAAMSNTLITGDEDGVEAMSALIIGAGALSATMAKGHGFFPLSKAKALAYDQDARITNQQLAADAGLSEQFSIDNPQSFTSKLALATVPATQNLRTDNVLGGLASLPITAFSYMGTSAQAASPYAVEGEYDMCDDDDYKQMDIVADPGCNPQYGMDPKKVGDASSSKKSEWEPDAVLAYMCGHAIDNEEPCDNWIDNDGKPIAEKEFDKFIKQCIESDKVLSSDKEEWPEGLDKNACEDPEKTGDPKKFGMFRMYYFDESINEQMTDADKEGDEAAAEPAADEESAVDGSVKELAQKILDNPKIHPQPNPRSSLQAAARGEKSPAGIDKCGTQHPPVMLDKKLLGFLDKLGQEDEFTITSLVTGAHSCTSNHYKGTAVDFGCDLDVDKANRIGREFGISRNTESCSDPAPHYHYSIGGN